MKIEKATYSYKSICECISIIKEFDFSFKSCACLDGLNNLEKLHDELEEKTGCILFNSDWDFYFQEFKKLLFQKATKKEKEKALKLTARYLQNQIIEIFSLIQSGEVNVID